MDLKKIISSIAFRISVSIAVVVAVATITVGWLILIEERNTLETELQNKGRYIVELMAHEVTEPLIHEERDKLYSLLKGTMNIKESPVVYAEVYDKNKELVVNAYKNPDVKEMKLPPFSFEDSVMSVHIQEDNTSLVYHLSLPVYDEHLGTIGFLRMSITKTFLHMTLENVIHKLYRFAAAVIVIGILLGLWMARKILRPVIILNKGVKMIAEGELGVEVPVEGEGEIKELALSFNKMSRKLKEVIDDIKAAQENLVRTEKLYAIGEFSAGVAHEIRNPLSSIKMLLQALEQKKQALSSKNFAIIQGEINRIDRIITEFLAFTRPEEAQKKDVNINDILEEVTTITRPMMEQSVIQLSKKFSPELPAIKGNNDALKQVFINIVLNAIQAMDEEGGTLRIETSAVNGCVSTMIKDTGVGIPGKYIDNIFNPFFTTKDKGTGMGLALTYKIVKNHSGNINIKSTPKIGTTVIVELPI